jgi:catechol 2,3-dioxygenase-like lactoylglutathione lyase family enzyme
MFDHVMIRVRDRAAAEAFYDAALGALGVVDTYRTDAVATWGEFILTAAGTGHPATTGLVLVFAAPSRERVDAFWAAGGRAGAAPHATPDGYAAALVDPDGNRVEALFDDEPIFEDGIVRAVRVRVADVAAATRFYTTVGEAAGLEVVEADAAHAELATVHGGRLVLAGGPVTRGLHLAFPAREEDVRRFHAAGVAAGYRDNGAPGERPRYHHGYYSAYLLDPDGTNVEVVDHHRD